MKGKIQSWSLQLQSGSDLVLFQNHPVHGLLPPQYSTLNTELQLTSPKFLKRLIITNIKMKLKRKNIRYITYIFSIIVHQLLQQKETGQSDTSLLYLLYSNVTDYDQLFDLSCVHVSFTRTNPFFRDLIYTGWQWLKR